MHKYQGAEEHEVVLPKFKKLKLQLKIKLVNTILFVILIVN